jgi:uncharacterized protein (UPF0276 family)
MRIDAAIPPRGGIGLKAEHYRVILEEKPDLGFFEIHAENYMGAGGLPHHYLAAIRERYPISLHGVGLSIGGARPLDREHLGKLRALSERYEPGLFSEHLAWSSHETGYLADLLPLPYTTETLARVCGHIDETQEAVGRQMLLENPATYVTFEESTYAEADFIAEIAQRTGCALLLDVNNVFVSATNHGYDPRAYLAAFPLDRVGEIHLAGHAPQSDEDGRPLLIDDHGSPIIEDVWALYADVIAKTGPLPTLIERDNDVPPLAAIVAQARRADQIMASVQRKAA